MVFVLVILALNKQYNKAFSSDFVILSPVLQKNRKTAAIITSPVNAALCVKGTAQLRA